MPRCHIFEGTIPSLSPNFQQFGQNFRAKFDLTEQLTAQIEELPSPTPKEQDELEEKDSSINPKKG